VPHGEAIRMPAIREGGMAVCPDRFRPRRVDASNRARETLQNRRYRLERGRYERAGKYLAMSGRICLSRSRAHGRHRPCQFW
jgi:hypothetical protein